MKSSKGEASPVSRNSELEWEFRGMTENLLYRVWIDGRFEKLVDSILSVIVFP
jgi:hypothetical protein